MTRYDRGSQIVFEANPQYWRGPPKLKRIVYRMVDSDTTMLTLLRTHEIDFYYRASETLVPSLRSIPGTRLLVTPFTRFADLGLNAGNPALADRRVRQALAYGTDRKEIIDKVTQGMALPAISTQPDFSWAHNPDVPRYPYDPKRAAALLDEAGWRAGPDGTRRKNGVPLHLDMIGFTGSSTAANTQVLVQHQWAGLGIDVSIKNFPSSQLYATLGAGGIEQSGKFDVVFENWANGPDPDQSILFRCTMAPPAGWNVYHFCSKDVDAAEAAALVEYDQEKRKALYAREQEILATELPIIMLWYQQQLDVVNTDFKGYRPAHAVTPFWNAWEWSI
jgi:peptide/nickel transport system substrate-binding protein